MNDKPAKLLLGDLLNWNNARVQKLESIEPFPYPQIQELLDNAILVAREQQRHCWNCVNTYGGSYVAKPWMIERYTMPHIINMRQPDGDRLGKMDAFFYLCAMDDLFRKGKLEIYHDQQ
ncbi:hypothetical protein [Pseudomonas virus PBPA162]|uniref:Uncharacterized protein n=1 Tax=Pseudomonas virus PBPA162 TaxID=2588096 RepID=A0A4Y5TQN2_9CAUD|nr:hypothetical protein PQC32_gp66 [Pseudomonas virus PBPA162]QDB70900.1 hypothetical protein [Pseudomonas virus PBPA162]